MSLSQLIQEAQTECFNKHGVFFAFSPQQLNEQKKEGVEYVSLGSGLICPKDAVKAFVEDHSNIVDAGIRLDLERNGKEKIIRRELANYECYYTGDIDDCVEALEDYGITAAEVATVFNKGE